MRRLRLAVEAESQLSDGYTYTVDTKTITLPEVAEWITIERLCCPFLTFQLNVSARGDVQLALRGPERAKAILHEEFRLLVGDAQARDFEVRNPSATRITRQPELTLLRCGVGERDGRHRGSRLRDPLVVTVGEAALKVRLECEGARDHMPGAVLLLRAEQVIDAPAVDGVGRRHAGFVQRPERFSGGIGVGGEMVGLPPASIRALFGSSCCTRLAGALRPAQAMPRICMLRSSVVRGSARFQPRGGASHALVEFGLASGNGIDAQRANTLGGVGKAAVLERRPDHAVIGPVAFLALHRGDVVDQRVRGERWGDAGARPSAGAKTPAIHARRRILHLKKLLLDRAPQRGGDTRLAVFEIVVGFDAERLCGRDRACR